MKGLQFRLNRKRTTTILGPFGDVSLRPPRRGERMQNQFDPRTTAGGYDPAVSVGVPGVARDAGLRSYMLKVYNYMASGVR